MKTKLLMILLWHKDCMQIIIMNPLFIILILFSFSCGIQGFSQIKTNTITTQDNTANLQKKFEEIASLHIKLLIENHILQIGQFNLNKFNSQIPSVKYAITKTPLYTQGRHGHRYSVTSNRVYLSQSLLNQLLTPEFIIESQLIILHETLGALGYYDEYYEISATIVALSSFLQHEHGKNLVAAQEMAKGFSLIADQRASNPINDFNTLSPYQKRLNDYYSQSAAVGGGVSEGGGGGSPAGAVIKSTLLLRLMSKKASMLILNFIINQVGIEIFNFQQNEEGLYFVCPYNKQSFLDFSKSINDDNHLILFLPAVCKNPTSPVQSYNLIEEFIHNKFIELSRTSPKMNSPTKKQIKY